MFVLQEAYDKNSTNRMKVYVFAMETKLGFSNIIFFLLIF